MKKVTRLGKLLAGVIAELRDYGARLAFRRQRWQHFHDLAHDEHERKLACEKQADRLRRAGKVKKATRQDRKAQLHARRAHHAHSKAIVQIQKVKALTAKAKGLARSRDDLKKRLAKAKKAADKVTINGNAVRGGSVDHRLQVAMLESAHRCSSGRRPNFYSQSGSWDVDHCLTGEPRGHRSDCSSWFASVYKSCGLPDPNGQGYSGGYTGTLGAHGKTISRGEASKTPGAAILFGSSPFHHVEMALGDGTTHTIGHGSPPIDMGSFDLLPGSKSFRKYPHS